MKDLTVDIGGTFIKYAYMKEDLTILDKGAVKIYIENDAKCAAMAEAAIGSLKDVNDGFIYKRNCSADF